MSRKYLMGLICLMLPVSCAQMKPAPDAGPELTPGTVSTPAPEKIPLLKPVPQSDPAPRKQFNEIVVKDSDTETKSRYIALDATGNPIPASSRPSNNNVACIRDQTTGLLWEHKKMTGGLQNPTHTYSWYSQDERNNGGFEGYQDRGQCRYTRCDTAAYIEALNKRRLCGLDQWRLPTRSELAGLVDYSRLPPDPAIDQHAFSNTAAQFYWSSTPSAANKDSAWGIGFVFGYDYAYFKSDHGHVRLVHDATSRSDTHKSTADINRMAQHLQHNIISTSPSNVFTDNGDGTVTDQRTGLMWMRCPVGQRWKAYQCHGKAVALDIEKFQKKLRNRKYAGHTDWRIPEIDELSTITELARINPAINVTIFPNTPAKSFWSNTVFSNDTRKYWQVQFLYGDNHVDNKSVKAHLRLVRDSK